MPAPFLSAADVRLTDVQGRFACETSAIRAWPGQFPGSIETDVGNACPLHLKRSLADEDGVFVGAAYRQSAGCEVLVFLD